MASNQDHEDDSFIILGSSPGTSLDLHCDVMNGQPLDKTQMDNAMKDLPIEATMALKAHFKLGDYPSPASMMVASTMVTEDKTVEDLQKRFGELLDENIILKETLKQNNDSLKDQFLLIASCQEDMMSTHKLHKEKFEETKGLVENLRQENKRLKKEMAQLAESASSSAAGKSGPASVLEFVTSPDDDTINKLTDQLELVEKQRRQVIVDNEKLTWQKESLEHIVDVTTKERDELKEKLQKAELLLSNKDSENVLTIKTLEATLQDQRNKLENARSLSNQTSEKLARRTAKIQNLEVERSTLQAELKAAKLKVMDIENAKSKVSSEAMAELDVANLKLKTQVSRLQVELQAAKLKVLDFDNFKLEYSRQKSVLSDTVKSFMDQIEDLKNKLKEAQSVAFRLNRVSVSPERQSSPEHTDFANNVKLYDTTLLHLSQHLNGLTHGLADNLADILGVMVSFGFKLEAGPERCSSMLAGVKGRLEALHSTALSNIGTVRNTLTIFEGIFVDYKKLLKIRQSPAPETNNPNVDALTAALLARGEEAQALRGQLASQGDDVAVLRAQVDLYKSDFDAERQCREAMASQNETLQADLRNSKKRVKELTEILQQLRRQGPQGPAAGAPATAAPAGAPTVARTMYTCPKCMRYKSYTTEAVAEHLDYCVGSNVDPCSPV